MKKGDMVLVSPELTGKSEWITAKVIKIENNSFVGVVISAESEDKDIFFGYKDLFKPLKEQDLCTQ